MRGPIYACENLHQARTWLAHPDRAERAEQLPLWPVVAVLRAPAALIAAAARAVSSSSKRSAMKSRTRPREPASIKANQAFPLNSDAPSSGFVLPLPWCGLRRACQPPLWLFSLGNFYASGVNEQNTQPHGPTVIPVNSPLYNTVSMFRSGEAMP